MYVTLDTRVYVRNTQINMRDVKITGKVYIVQQANCETNNHVLFTEKLTYTCLMNQITGV